MDLDENFVKISIKGKPLIGHTLSINYQLELDLNKKI